MIKAVVFDFRDTLLKVAGGYEAMRRQLLAFVRSQNIKISGKELERLNMQVIKSQKQKISRNKKLHNAMPVFVRAVLKKLRVKFDDREYAGLLRRMNDAFAGSVSLYPDAKKLLRQLKKSRLMTAVVIDGTAYRERKIIKRLDLAKYLDAVIISQEVGYNKFTAEPLKTALKMLKTKPANVLVVGDRLDKDIVHANKLGCVSVRLVRNQGRYADLVSVKQNEKPDHTIRNLSELRKFLV